jgi:hypothetical protein
MEDYSTLIKSAIDNLHVHELKKLAKHIPHTVIPLGPRMYNPLWYIMCTLSDDIFKELIKNPDNSVVEIYKILIENSNIDTLNELDTDGDTLFPYILNFNDDKYILYFISKLHRAGYNFDKTYNDNHSDIEYYLNVYSDPDLSFNREIFRKLLSFYSNSTLSEGKTFILNEIAHLSFDDMVYCLELLHKKDINVFENDNMIEKISGRETRNDNERIKKITYLIKHGAFLPEIDKICKNPKRCYISPKIIKHLVNLGIIINENKLSHALLHYLGSTHLHLEVIKLLCKLGANVTFRIGTSDIIHKFMDKFIIITNSQQISKHLEVFRLLLSFAPSDYVLSLTCPVPMLRHVIQQQSNARSDRKSVV